MSSKKSLVPSLIFLLTIAACSPAMVPAAPVEIQPTAIEAVETPTIAPTIEVTPLSTSTTEAEPVFPYYLPLATKPNIEPQTINGVTAQIDWVYVDESRITLRYTISGLDWPEGTMWDSMLVRITSPDIPDSAYSGGGGWGNPPVEQGVITGIIDQLFWDGAVDASKHPDVDLTVELPVEDPFPVGTFRFEFTTTVLDGIRMENLDHTVVANDVSMTLK
jgi:hypothetical protein